MGKDIDYFYYGYGARVPIRYAFAKDGRNYNFAPSSFDDEDAYYDTYIYAYIPDDIFYNATEKEFQEYIDKYYD